MHPIHQFATRFVMALSILLPRPSAAQTTHHYSKEDSLKAKAYFNKSWNYSLGSVSHQLYLDSALLVIPTHSYYWQQKSMPYYKGNKFELGRPFLDSAVKYDPGRWLEYRAFMKCIYEKSYKAALEDFNYARYLYGNRVVMDHPYNFYIALCHLQLDNYDSSEYYLKDCINNDIKTVGEKWIHPNHFFYLGILFRAKEDYKTAIEYFDRSIGGYKNFSDAHYYKALCLYELKNVKEALASMEAANTFFQQGYTFNEDNSLHQDYPYQLRKSYMASSLEWMRKEASKSK